MEQEQSNQNAATEKEPIAIIGIGCRFPGGVNNPESFWQLLCDEVDAVTEIPSDRIDIKTLYDPRPATPGKIMTRWGGFLEQIDQLDAAFLEIAPREAEQLDPQQRLLLEVAWEALEDGGQVVDRSSGDLTGVFVGLWLNDFEARLFNDPARVGFYMTTGSGRYAASGRISYAFGFEGPSITIDTACSSSLVAVHLACRSLWSDECSMALAGGANIILQPHISIAYSQTRMMAPDGRCKFGDARADGYVRSEGAGIVVLKPLARAVADGDPVYAVIRGSAVNNDGRSGGYMATPSQPGQEALLRQAYQDAAVSPGRVHYVEAHGTGTRAGDPVEIGALGNVLAANRTGRHCFVGSVKTNFGHTEGAAGIAGLIKVALALKHRTIPASLHLQELNPTIPWKELPVTVPRQLTPWPDDGEMAVAGVSAFGITGTNAHVVLAEAPARLAVNEPAPQPVSAYVLPLSAHTPEAVAALAGAYESFLTAETAPPLQDIVYTASCRRTHLEHRLALVGHDRQEMAQQARAFLEDEARPGIAAGQAVRRSHKVAFVFPGQGSQWLGMGRELMAREPVFRHTLEQCEAAIGRLAGWSLLEQLAAEETDPAYRLDQIDVIQPTLLSIEIALAELWRAWGVEPDAVIGHSMGEVGAAYTAGALSLEDAMAVICGRSRLLRRVSGQGAMAVVELSLEQAQAALAGYEARLSIAVSNSPRSTVLSGDPEALDEMMARLQSQDVFCRLIKVDVASHSPQMDPLQPDLFAMLEGIQPRPGAVPIYSTATGAVIDGAACDNQYWVKNLRQPVLFARMIQQLLADEHTVFIEMSPHPILLPSIEQGRQHGGYEAVTLPSLRRHEAEQVTMLASLGKLYTVGYPVAWQRLYPAALHASLPPYPWQRERYWYEPAQGKVQVKPARPGAHPLLAHYLPVATGTHIWETTLSRETFDYLDDHQVRGAVVFPAAAYVEMALAAATEAFGAGAHSLEQVTFKEALFLPDQQPYTLQLILSGAPPGALIFQIFGRIAGAGEQLWTSHSEGTVRLNQAAVEPTAIEVAVPAPEAAIPGEAHYQAMQARGLGYGPAFQGVARWWRREGTVAADLQLSQAVAGGRAYQVHPALLDACLQLLVAALPDEVGSQAAGDTYLPVRIDSIQVYGRPDNDKALRGYAVRRSEATTLAGDVYLLDEAGRPLVVARGLHFQRLERAAQANDGAWLDDCLYQVQWQRQPRPDQGATNPGDPGHWLIFSDSIGVGQALAARLQAQEETCVLVSCASAYGNGAVEQVRLNPANPDDFKQLFQEVVAAGRPLRGIVHLWSLDSTPAAATTIDSLNAAQERGSVSVLHLVQALGQSDLPQPPRLWLVTRGAQAVSDHTGTVNVAQAPLWGMGGVIAQEHPELRCTRVDLDSTPQPEESQALWAELWSEIVEDQIALRGQERYVAVLDRTAREAMQPTIEPVLVKAAPGEGFQLVTTTPGVLDNLSLQAAARRLPGPGEVEIEVYATGLNFLDVMKAMGIYPGLDAGAPVAMGAECAGRVTAVGAGVAAFKTGDDVIAITPSLNTTSFFSAYVTIPADLAVHKPATLSFAEAATLPVAFLTAYYALHTLGRLSRGERVLIHAAAGGVGLAAVQLAQMAGAEIFATAGSPEKRAYLQSLGVRHVMDSRSLDFAAEIMAQTGGEGVDVVLNSLAGEFIPRTLAVLAPYGRFLEIGKRDIYQNSPLGLEPFKKNLSFYAIDLARLIEERPSLVISLLHEIMQYVSSSALRPLPVHLFGINDVREAFRTMAQARHTGKIVVSRQDQEACLATVAEPPAPVRHDATYLITGGLGSLGLLAADWLVRQGARHLALVGRSRPSETAQAAIEALQQAGAQVVVAGVDVSQADQVADLLATIEPAMPPLRGIMHAAGLLADSTLLQMDRERLEQAIAPKVQGGWNLHMLTAGKPLDFFVLFSSVAALLGSPGQANYAAGNAFLDALAHQRRAQGLPALSINWGPWSEVGLAAAQANRGDRLAQRGLGSLTPAQGIEALAKLLPGPAVQVAVMPFDAAQWRQTYPSAGQSSFLCRLLQRQNGETEATGSPATERNVRTALLALEAGRPRRLLLESHLRQQIAQVLRLSPARVEAHKPVKSFGLDSLMAVELRNRLEASLGVSLSATLVFNYPTVAVMTPYVAEKMGIALESDSNGTVAAADVVSPGPVVEAAVDVTAVQQLSDEDAEALLLKELEEIDF